MGKKFSNTPLRASLAVLFCLATVAAPLINSLGAFAAVPEGLIANDDDDTPNGEINTDDEEEFVDGWTMNSSNLYSGKMESGDVRIRNLKIADATLNEYDSSNRLVTDENNKVYKKVVHGSKTSVVREYVRAGEHFSNTAELIFGNAVEITKTGELLDLKLWMTGSGISGGASQDSDIIFGLIKDSPESGYTMLQVGAFDEGTSNDVDIRGVYQLFTLTALKHDTSTLYAEPLISVYSITDFDARDFGVEIDESASCPLERSWNGSFADAVWMYYGNGHNDNKIYTINNPSLDFSTFIKTNGRLSDGSLQCNSMRDDDATLQTGFIASGDLSWDGGSLTGIGMQTFHSLDQDGLIIDFNLDFPLLETDATEGGTITKKGETIIRNFGEPYTVTVTPDEDHNIKKITIRDLDSGDLVTNFTLEDFLDEAATEPGSVVTLDNGIQFKYKGDGVVNVIFPTQYMLKRGDVVQPDYDDFSVVATFETEDGEEEPPVPSTGGNPENPNTFDAVYLFVAIFGIAGAALYCRDKARR